MQWMEWMKRRMKWIGRMKCSKTRFDYTRIRFEKEGGGGWRGYIRKKIKMQTLSTTPFRAQKDYVQQQKRIKANWFSLLLVLKVSHCHFHTRSRHLRLEYGERRCPTPPCYLYYTLRPCYFQCTDQKKFRNRQGLPPKVCRDYWYDSRCLRRNITASIEPY